MNSFVIVHDLAQVKDNNNISGRGRKSTPFYDELDAILGTRAASRPPVLLDSGGNEIPREEGIYFLICIYYTDGRYCSSS